MRVFDSRKALAFGMFLLAFTLVVQAVGPAAGPKDTAVVKAVKDVAITTHWRLHGGTNHDNRAGQVHLF